MKIESNAEELALLGQKIALLITLNYVQDELEKVNRKIIKINKKRMFSVLKGKKND